jgi:hypothetical protein
MRYNFAIKKYLTLKFATFFVSLLALFVACLFLYMYASGPGKETVKNTLPSWIVEPMTAFRDGISDLQYAHLAFRSSDLPRYNIRISAEDMKVLEQSTPDLDKRREDPAYVEGIDDRLRDENRVYVPVTFEHDGKQYDTKMRYRGNSAVHWDFDKKSFRIRFDKDSLFGGTKDVNFVLPHDRGYVIEEFNHWRAREMGLLVPDSGFAIVTINGKNPSLYWQVEHFSKEFLEKHGVSGDINMYGEGDTFQQHLYTDANYWQKFTENPRLGKDHAAELKLLIYLLNDASDEEFYARIFDVIDKDTFYDWTIHNLLAGSWHQDYSHNLRTYFDSSDGLFKIMPWDVYLYRWKDVLQKDALGLEATANPLVDRILRNDQFMQERNARLWKYLSDKDDIQRELEYFDSLVDLVSGPLYKDPIKRFSFTQFRSDMARARTVMEDNLTRLRELYLNPKASFVLSNRIGSNVMDFEIANFQSTAPIFLDQIEIEFLPDITPVPFSITKDGKDVCRADRDAISGRKATIACTRVDLPPKLLPYDPDPDIGRHYAFDIFRLVKNKHAFELVPDGPLDLDMIDTLDVTIRNSFTEKKVKDVEGIFADVRQFEFFSDISQTPAEFVAKHPQFSVASDGTLLLGPGQYAFARTVIIPKRTKLTIAPGTTIRFASHASLVSYSPILARGSQQAPIQFIGPGTKDGGNVVVLKNDGRSEFIYSHFSGGGEDTVNGAFFSGMLAIHHADSVIQHSLFENAKGDDALNVKYASSTVAFNTFRNNSADAIDYDFSDGVIERNVFVDNGNDSIDTSGSPVLIQFNDIFRSGDKCISVGEGSAPVIFNNVLDNCHIGIETKDLSRSIIINNVIVNNDIGLNAYQKKEIFGGGFATVISSIIWNNGSAVEDDGVSETTITYSAVQGDYQGEKNFDVAPAFTNAQARDFTNSQSDANMRYLEGGDGTALEDYLGMNVGTVPVGLVESL